MIYCKTISVNFILFHFGAFYILSNNMESLISYKENIETYKRLEAQFIDHIDNWKWYWLMVELISKKLWN